jgi:hypothetical protein
MKFSSNFSSLAASMMLLQGFQHVSAENFGKMCFNTNMGGTCTQFAADGIFECGMYFAGDLLVSLLIVFSPIRSQFQGLKRLLERRRELSPGLQPILVQFLCVSTL